MNTIYLKTNKRFLLRRLHQKIFFQLISIILQSKKETVSEYLTATFNSNQKEVCFINLLIRDFGGDHKAFDNLPYYKSLEFIIKQIEDNFSLVKN
jgi:hypothetical protein